MKKKILVGLVLVLVAVMALTLFACKDKDGEGEDNGNGISIERRVPVYQGMTISTTKVAGTPSFSPPPADDHPGNHYGWGNGKHHGDCTDKDMGIDQDIPFEEDVPTIEDTSESKLSVIGAAESIYYADKNEDIYITIHLSNPSDFEIVSFTLNSKKWANYMFEPGSNLENLILKLNVGEAAGIVEYTIDAIKYIEGEDIKDVLMNGDKKVKAGIRSENQIFASVTSESSTLTEIKFDGSITDTCSLIQKSGGYAKAVLYDGINLVEKDIEEGQTFVLLDIQ